MQSSRLLDSWTRQMQVARSVLCIPTGDIWRIIEAGMRVGEPADRLVAEPPPKPHDTIRIPLAADETGGWLDVTPGAATPSPRELNSFAALLGATIAATSTTGFADEIRAAERRRLGQLAHDTVMQELTSIGLRLGAIARIAPPELAARLSGLGVELSRQQALLRRTLGD